MVCPARELSFYAQDAERIDGHQGGVGFFSKRNVGRHVEARYDVGKFTSSDVKLCGIRAKNHRLLIGDSHADVFA